MSVVGYVGLMGSGKTRQVVRCGLDARAAGREIFANFKLGQRTRGWLVPVCNHWGCGNYDEIGHHDRANSRHAAFSFEPASPLLDELARRRGWRGGRGFVPWAEDVDKKLLAPKVLTSWSQLEALRVHRDELGAVHRTRLVETGVDDKGVATYTAERDCDVWDCTGCSKGITVLIDELNLWAPSRLWAELGLGVLQRWAYARKDGLDIVWSAQHEARIDKVAREVTEHIWSCNGIGGSMRIGRVGGLRVQLFRKQKFIPALMTDKNRTMAAEGGKSAGLTDFSLSLVVRAGTKLSTREEDAYDTFEHVSGSGHLESQRSVPQAASVVAFTPRRASAPPARSVARTSPGTGQHPKGRSEAKETG